MSSPLILLTNDDGIQSPGLAAAAEALDSLGELLIIAPSEQQTSMSRSRSQQYGADGSLRPTTVTYNDKTWQGISANATPALAVEHAVQEIAERPIALAVSGINYGENIGSCVTVSGTIGAAIEAAERGIPSLAVSLEILGTDYHTHSKAVDFSVAIHFTRLIAGKMLNTSLPHDVDVLKLEIPASATKETKWVVTRQDKLSYYMPHMEERNDFFTGPAKLHHTPAKGQFTMKDTDAYAAAQGWVSVTPLSYDLTSRVSLDDFADSLGTSALNK
jgi:5'-nucleotidase